MSEAKCEDCGEPYGSPRFPDLVIDHEAFAKIASRPPSGGLFCPNCLVARLEKAGLENVSGKFTSGPLASPAPDRVSDERKALNKIVELCLSEDAPLDVGEFSEEVFGIASRALSEASK